MLTVSTLLMSTSVITKPVTVASCVKTGSALRRPHRNATENRTVETLQMKCTIALI